MNGNAAKREESAPAWRSQLARQSDTHSKVGHFLTGYGLAGRSINRPAARQIAAFFCQSMTSKAG